jgi:hypothetical protein
MTGLFVIARSASDVAIHRPWIATAFGLAMKVEGEPRNTRHCEERSDVAIWGHLDDGGSGENDGGAALGFGAGGFAHDDLDVVA